MTDKGNYSFTFVIPSTKMVYHSRKRTQYGLLTQRKQFTLLESVMCKIAKSYWDIKWIYEEHEDSRLHIHGFLKNVYFEEVENFRRDFYHNHAINIQSYKKYCTYSNIQRTLVDIGYFEEYMKKNQHLIKYKCGFLMQIDETNNLNGDVPKDKYEIRQDYFNSLLYDTESRVLDDGYNFGKLNNKYIVEL